MTGKLHVTVILLISACVGCGDETYDLKARVTLDGQPLEGAAVTLTGTSTRPATGITDANGNVQFTTFEPSDGVLPGEYTVLVSKMPKNQEEEFAALDPNDPEDYQRMVERERSSIVPNTPSVLPRMYLDAAKTPLKCKVPPETDEVIFALESDAGKRKS